MTAIYKTELDQLRYTTAIKDLFGNDIEVIDDFGTLMNITPRGMLLKKGFSINPLRYIQILANASPSKMVDIGCGKNLFNSVINKLFGIPVHGIDPNNQDADEINSFDAHFSQTHTNAYESAFSINALHFIPLSDLTTRINEFYNIIAPGGYGFLSLNSARMVDHSNKIWLLRTFQTQQPNPLQVEKYVRDQISTLKINFIVAELSISSFSDEWLDGNIRLVFKK
jgi:hypothetical protein